MNSITFQSQLAQVGENLNQVLRREGKTFVDEMNLNAKIKRTYPKEG
ncbi:MAG: hypothetical protein AAF960_01510 [Bacteroidota bacterium]